jgi:hypothetical protein
MRYIYVIFAAFFVFAAAAGSGAGGEKPEGLATVKSESLAVHSRTSAASSVIRRLERGDVVTVQFELDKAGLAWCAVSEEGNAEIIGYSQCKYLAREKKKAWVRAGVSGETPAPGATTEVKVVGNHVVVPVGLEYGGRRETASLLLDTGASGTAISSDVASALRMDISKAIKVKAMVLGGNTIDIRVVQLDRLTVGPHRLDDPVVGVYEHKGAPVFFDGVLGMDFLSSLDYEVDLKNRVIKWGRR